MQVQHSLWLGASLHRENATIDLDQESSRGWGHDLSVPWIGFPVGYAVSGILLTVFGYFAMLLAQ